jgi:hypothetical protein
MHLLPRLFTYRMASTIAECGLMSMPVCNVQFQPTETDRRNSSERLAKKGTIFVVKMANRSIFSMQQPDQLFESIPRSRR